MIIKAIGLTIGVLLLTGAAFLPVNKLNSANKPVAHQEVKFVKPGAAVDLTHDYNGKTQKGEIETVTLTLNHIYEEGYLTVSLLPPLGLQMISDTNPHIIKLYPDSKFTLPVQFSSTIDGVYALAVEAVYESLDGHQSRRVLSVPISIGIQATEKTQSSRPKDVQVSAKGIIALPAREMIK